MPLPEAIGDDACGLARRWVLDPTLAAMLVRLEAEARRQFDAGGIRWPGLRIISGFRTSEHQAQLNPAVTQSYHTRCPSLAADLRLGADPPVGDLTNIWAILGGIWELMGGRWGGRFQQADLNHFDLGAGVPPPAL